MNLRRSEEFSRKIVRELSALRQAKGMTKQELARLSGVSRSMISMMERGERHPTVVTLHALATALDCKVIDLLQRLEER